MSLNKQLGFALLAIVVLAALALFCWLQFLVGYPPSINWANVRADSPAIEYYKLLQGFMDMLFVGVAVGLAAIIIPSVISSRREAFERYKEARQAYSEATTGVLYLPERLAALDMKDGMTLINQVHEKKHIAETYAELEDQMKRRSGDRTAKQWSTNMWKTLDAYKKAVSANADTWDGMERKKKIEILRAQHATLQSEINNYFT